MRKFHRTLALLLVAVIALSLAACGTAESENAASSGGGEESQSASGGSGKDSMTISVGSDFSNLAPNGLGTEAPKLITTNVYARLFDASKDGVYTMDAATSVEYEDDLHILIQIRDDVYDERGNHLTASDVLYSIQLAADGSTNYPTFTIAIDFDNCEVVDETTLRLALSSVYSFQYTLLGRINLVTQAGFEASSDGMITDVVATGAYRVEEIIAGSSVTLVANENWYGGEPAIKTVNVKVISETSQVTNALEAGDIDFGYKVAASDVGHLNNQPQLYVNVADTQTMWGIFFNCTEGGLFDTAEARRAVAYALDSNAVINVALDGYGTPAVTGVPQSCFDYNAEWDNISQAHDNYYAQDLDKARELAESAGLTGQTVRLIYTSAQAPEKTMAEMVQSQFQAIGVDAVIDVYDDSVYNDTIQNDVGDWDICFQIYGNSAGSGLGCLNTFILTMNQPHLSGSLMQQFETLVTEAIAITDDAQRIAKTNDIIEILTSEVPMYGFSTSVHLSGLAEGLHFECRQDTVPHFASCYWE